MHALANDIRFAVRQLLKRPAFTAIAAVTLALGIGANTALFSVINALLVRSLPFENVGRLVLVGSTNRKAAADLGAVTYADFFDWRKQSDAFEQLAAFCGVHHNLRTNDGPEQIEGARVSANFFDLLRIRPVLGRTFLPAEEAAGAPRVALISNSLWRQRFNKDPGLLGQTLWMDGQSVEVIGILPAGFRFPIYAEYGGPLEVLDAGVWTTTASDAGQYAARDVAPVSIIGRLAPGVSIARANTQMDGIARRLESEHPDTNTDRAALVVGLRERTIAHVKPAVVVLSAAVGLVLLIACANVASLFLVRNEERRRELAVRAALGAGRSALVRQLLVETTAVGLAGGVLGLLTAFWSLDALVTLLPANLPGRDQVGLDLHVLIFTATATLLVSGLCGLAPAWQACRCEPASAMKEERAVTVGRSGNRLRGTLVVAEMALAVVLLIGAGLLTRSFERLLNVPPGFDTAKLLTFRMSQDMAGYTDPGARAALYDQVLERLRALPSVQSASASTAVPLAGGGIAPRLSIVERPEPRPGEVRAAFFHSVDHTFLQTLGTPLLRGRYLTAADQAATSGVTVVNEAMARYFWPDEDPIGKHVRLGRWFSDDEPEIFEIVGIVGNVQHRRLDTEPIRAMYVPYKQQTWPFMEFAVRTRGDPEELIEPIRRSVATVTSDEAPYQFRTMEQIVATSVSQQRAATTLMGAFSALALLLAAVGIYGLLSYSVAQRTREIGVRTAFGARTADILRLVLWRGMTLTAIGLALGVGLAVAGTRLLASQLFATSPLDPLTFVAVPLFFVGVALLASYIPARRATRVDPMIALRCE